jgi:hypothetical protein
MIAFTLKNMNAYPHDVLVNRQIKKCKLNLIATVFIIYYLNNFLFITTVHFLDLLWHKEIF